MSILSASFLLFFIILLAVYYIVPGKYRWAALLAGSLIFYLCSAWKYGVLLIITVGTTFFGAKALEKLNRRIKEETKALSDREAKKALKNRLTRQKKRLTAAVLLLNFGILFVFKTPFIAGHFSLLLPLGISFYTFQTIGYLIDVYRGKFPAEKSILKYGLFASYFPQIIQGPINRYEQFGPELFKEHRFQWKNIKYGGWLFLWGMFKKLVISDRAAIFVNTVFAGELADMPGSVLFLSVCIFNIQLYGDFSGGIDMVRGISRMFGIEMAENFCRPFFSRTLGEYWRRWHISLGAWIKDYVFYPVAMSKTFANIGTKTRKTLGVHMGKTLPAGLTSVLTFVLIGIWHEVAWYYVAYGVWHGMIMALSSLCAPLFARWNEFFQVRRDCMSFRWFQRGRTWVLITIGEYFSLSGNMKNLLQMFKTTMFHFRYPVLFYGLGKYGLDGKEWMVLIAAVMILIFVSMKQEAGCHIREAIERQNLWFQWCLTVGIVFVTAVFGIYGPGYDAASFIYGGF